MTAYGEEYILGFTFGVLETDKTGLDQGYHPVARAYWDELVAMTGCVDSDL
jgi:hypothetical protein